MRSATRCARSIARSKERQAVPRDRGRRRPATLDIDNAALRRNLGKLAEALAVFPVAKTRPFFDAMEKAKPGSGGLYSRHHRPVEVHAAASNASTSAARMRWSSASRTPALLETLQARFEFLSRTPNTPARFVDGATKPDGDTKRLMLDRNNYYATTGGHGACRGCGEVTAIRLVIGANHAIHERAAQGAHPRAGRPDREAERQAAGGAERRPIRAARAHRADDRDAGEAALSARERPDRQRPGRDGDRQRHRLQQRLCLDLPVQPLQRSVGEQPVPGHPGARQGHLRGPDARRRSSDFRALRIAKLELDDAYDPQVHDTVLQALRLEPVHARGAGAAADRDQHRRRRRHLRHRLRRAVARC